MTVMAAVALGGLFTGCSNDVDLNGGNTAEFNIVKNYEDAFVTRFGQPHENQTWGFGESSAGTRSGNTSGDYTPWPYTHGYEDASGKLIASANMNHNQWGSTDLQSMPFGGWVVPDPLTEGQKLRVQKYFQANPNLSYKDPEYANFYVQQVYTGGTSAPTTGNKESTAAADGTVHAGATLNQLTVGAACSHINDFNAGTCTTSSVLNHEGKTQNDQITLMLNVDDTSCFGYHETGGSNVKGVINHNDKMALVSAATIDAWAAANGNPGEAVVDKWNRSFMGFDYELLPESDIIPDNPTYAELSAVPNINNIQYAWDGQKVRIIGPVPANTEGTPGTPDTKNDDFDLFYWFAQKASGNTNGNGETATTFYSSDGKIICYLPLYTQITFTQEDADWGPYSKLVIGFEASPIDATLSCNGNSATIAQGDTSVEVATGGIHWYNYGPVIAVANGTTGTLNITSVKLIGKTIPGTPGTPGVTYDPDDYYNPTYLLGDNDADKIMFYDSSNTNMYGGTIIELTEDDMKTYQDGKTCLNLVKFRQLKNDGYHPISTDLKKWVKWEAACDGYYSDWIVTLTEAKRITTEDPPYNPPTDPNIVCRIIVEDLTVGENSDFDFNDVVFDVCKNGTLIIRAIGGELPIYIGEENANEVHEKCSITLGDTEKGKNSHMFMRNTGWTWSGGKASADIEYDAELGYIYLNRTFNEPADALDIDIWVHKNGKNIKLQAPKGKVASMVCVGTDYEWCAERQDIDKKFHTKSGVKLFSGYVRGQYTGRWQDKDGWYHHINDE